MDKPPRTPRNTRRRIGALLFLALVTASCTDTPARQPPPIPPGALAAQHEEWRVERLGSLADPEGGVVSWIGLWELAEGPNRFGSDSSLAIALPPEDSPPLAGTLHLANGQVRLLPEAGSGIAVRDGMAVTAPLTLEDDRAENTTVLTLGSLGLRVHAERGTDRLWLRAWDRDSPRAAAFALPPYFPVTNEWRLAARFDSYSEPRDVPMADVTGGTVANVSPGELVFRAEGREHHLVVFATASSPDFLVMLRDSTAFAETYPLGRYMHVPFAGDDGWTVIDFNRAYNPPCAFTPWSVCGFPPRENRLALAVRAGEKRPEGPLIEALSRLDPDTRPQLY